MLARPVRPGSKPNLSILLFRSKRIPSFLPALWHFKNGHVHSARRFYAQMPPSGGFPGGFQGMQLNGDPAKGQALKEYVRFHPA